MSYSIGISPCPNDTFIFDKLLNDAAYQDKYKWTTYLEDVETLNDWALEGKLDITKVSFATYLMLQDKYQLLSVGSALGRGVGPLLLAYEKRVWDYEAINQARVGIPGLHTTANLLLSLAYPDIINKVVLPFHHIEDALMQGLIDLGLVIHESRFTYADKGLTLIQDMGEWWESTCHLPIPLGCIVAKKDIATSILITLEQDIRESLEHSWAQYPQLSSFVQCHAQEMSEEVMRQHIELYVNEETMQLSEQARAAIAKLSQVRRQ